MNKYAYGLVALVMVLAVGCTTPAKKIKEIRLGMTPEEVLDVMDKPFTIRAAKVFQDGYTTEVWEYQPRFFEVNPKVFWIYFENAKVVQWGEPGDFAGKSGRAVPVDEYKPFKSTR